MTKSGAIRTAFFLRVIFVLYKNFFVVYSILDEPPLSLSGFCSYSTKGECLAI